MDAKKESSEKKTGKNSPPLKKIQTAEGWKRATQKKIKEGKK